MGDVGDSGDGGLLFIFKELLADKVVRYNWVVATGGVLTLRSSSPFTSLLLEPRRCILTLGNILRMVFTIEDISKTSDVSISAC